MKLLVSFILIESVYGFHLNLNQPRLVSLSLRMNESEASYTTTSKKFFLESKLFISKEQRLDILAVEDTTKTDVDPLIVKRGEDEDSFTTSEKTNSRWNDKIDELRMNDDEVSQRINAVNVELDELAKDAAIIEELDRQRIGLLDDEKVSIDIAKVLTEALNGYENSDRMEKLFRNMRESRLSIERSLSAVLIKKKIASEQIQEIQAEVEKKIKKIEEDLEFNLKENENEIDDATSSMSDEFKIQIQIELFREKKMSDLIRSVQTSIQIKTSNSEQLKKMETEDSSYSIKQSSSLSHLIRNQIVVSKYDIALLDTLVDIDAFLQMLSADSVKRRRQLESTLESIQHSNWIEDIQAKTSISELRSLENIIEKAVNDLEKESKQIYSLRDKFNDNLISKSVALSNYDLDS